MEETLTYDQEDALVRGQIPLQVFKECLKKTDEAKIKTIAFPRNGYCNDAVVKLICSEKKTNYENLEEINLVGCTLISNAGIKWLAELVVGAPQLKEIKLDGNRHLSDNELSLLLKNVSSECKVVMRGTSVAFTAAPSTRKIEITGCPLLSNQSSKEFARQAHALFIPHDSVEHSLTQYVDSKKLTKRQSLERKTIDVGEGNWLWNFTEMNLNHPLLDSVLSSNQAQIIIPFGESAVLKEIIKHVTDTISRTITKMAFTTNYLKNEYKEVKEAPTEVDNFITTHIACQQQLDDDVLGNYCYKSEILGCFISDTPLTRSNPYFEIEVIESKIVDESGSTKINIDLDSEDSDDGEMKTGLLIGVLFERLYSCKNPLEIDVEKGGEVATFEFHKGQKRFGFGIQGDWISEYIPAKSAKFFATQDGIENNKDLTGVKISQEMLLPLIACLGDHNSASKCRISNMLQPPQELVDKWKKDKKWITKEFIQNAVIDVNGVISCDSSSDSATFISRESIEDEFSVKILEIGNFGKISISLLPDNEKDEKLAKKHSWKFQGVTGEVLSAEETKYLVDPRRVESGDILTFKLEKGPDSQTWVVVVFKNDQRIVETNFKPLLNVQRSINKLHILIEEAQGKVQLLNYRPKYKGPILFPESLTVGRLHSLHIFDDGTLKQVDINDKKRHLPVNLGSGFIAKSPMNSKLLSFEVENLNPTPKDAATVYVGICSSDIRQVILERNKNALGHFEVSIGTVLFTSNGRLLAETSKETVIQEGMSFDKGDKIKCEVDKVPSAEKLNFDEDGNIVPQQEVLIKFYLNDKLMHECNMTLRSEGLHPAVFMDDNLLPSGAVKIHNFYAETKENRLKANIQKNADLKKNIDKLDAKKDKAPCPQVEDCHYIVVEVGKTAGKLQLVEEQLKGGMFDTALENLSKSIDYYEKNFSTMDLNDQLHYASLCEAKEKIKNLVNKPKRISYISLDMTNNQGLDVLLEKMSDVMNSRKTHQESRYFLPTNSVEKLNLVNDCIKNNRIIEFGPGIKDDFDQKPLKMNGHLFLQCAKVLQEQGRVVILQLSSKYVIADLDFLQQANELLDKITTMELAGKFSTALTESSHVWTEEVTWRLFSDWEKKIPLLLNILQEYAGLIELPAWRTEPDDPQFIYTTLDALSAPPVPLREFWSKGDTTKDFIVMQKTFSFIHSTSDHILSALLSAAAKYGRTLVLAPQGGVFQIGCVQTVVVTHQGLMDLKLSDLQPSFENRVISIESKCYIPDKKSGPVDDLTEVYVKEYTWNVFCLYTDMLEKVLKQRNILFMVSGDYPTDLVNISVGCKHCWKPIPGKANQSVCTMCNKCCDRGRKCKYNGIMGDNLRECLCKTSASGCIDCGICVDCAASLWSTRSFLRPLPLTEMEPKSKPSPEVKTDSSTQAKKVNTEDLNKNSFFKIPLDPIGYDEIEYQHLSGGIVGMTLLEVDDGSCVSVFPGKATNLSMGDTNKTTGIGDKIRVLHDGTKIEKYKHHVGNAVTIKLSDPYRSITRPAESTNITGVQESRVVYHACISREMTISHETGLLCYNSASSSVPVAQFIGPKPFSENLKKISLKIISPGKSTNIGIGITPGKTYPANRMPGWNRWSIAYHADDGGIFIEAGAANTHTEKCTQGDVMSMFCDVTTRQLVFYKNDKQVKEIKINVPRGGYWPAIGLHSIGECVKLLEKDPWTPDPEEVPPKPTAFNTFKYGNLWISPARNISLTKKAYSDIHHGWLLLHNPTKFVIGYVITPDELLKTSIGSIAPNETVPLFLNKTANTTVDTATVSWISIEQVKEYSTEQISTLFKAASESSTYSHKLTMTIKSTTLGDVDALQPFNDNLVIDERKVSFN